jgi:hypothetical protein
MPGFPGDEEAVLVTGEGSFDATEEPPGFLTGSMRMVDRRHPCSSMFSSPSQPGCLTCEGDPTFVHEARRCGRLSPAGGPRNIFQAYTQYAQHTFNITRAHAQASPCKAPLSSRIMYPGHSTRMLEQRGLSVRGRSLLLRVVL